MESQNRPCGWERGRGRTGFLPYGLQYDPYELQYDPYELQYDLYGL
ncbi:hypothetical protein ABZ702_05665 [Streptomyces cyaneofuscatus]